MVYAHNEILYLILKSKLQIYVIIWMNLPQIGTSISLILHVLLELSHMPHPEVQSMSPPLDPEQAFMTASKIEYSQGEAM